MVLPTERRSPAERAESDPRYYRWGASIPDYEVSLQKVKPTSPFLLAIDHSSHEEPILWVELKDSDVYGLWCLALEHLVQRGYVDNSTGAPISEHEVVNAFAWAKRETKGYEA